MTVLAVLDYPTVSVTTAAKVLRMNPKTIYRNIREIPHEVIAGQIHIPVTWLMCEYKPPRYAQINDVGYDPNQLEFVYDVPIRAMKRYRNGDVRKVGDYELGLSKKPWRNKL